jgi:glycosyltransferase involved in cell wall biosynthesis
MFIVGVSNQSYVGVTEATKAICNRWVNAEIKKFPTVTALEIKELKPDLVIFGGWAPGFKEIIENLRGLKILVIWHGTQFHDDFYDSEKLYVVLKRMYYNGQISAIGFAHAGMAEYEKRVGGIDAYFIPHTFKINEKKRQSKNFNIHVVGAKNNVLKNGTGQYLIAKDFESRYPNVTVSRDNVNIPREKYIETIKESSLILHMSHIECYPNTIQEAWSYGIPCIFSPASCGLLKNPAIECDITLVRKCLVKSATEPFDLFAKIHNVYNSWNQYSSACYEYIKRLNAAAETYTKNQLEKICK